MKTIALLDHHSGGHHLAFIRLFTKYLLKLDYNVILFFPDKEKEIINFLIEQNCDLKRVLFVQSKLKRRQFKYFGRLNNAIASAYLWYETSRCLRKSEKLFKVKIDVVFFSWLDDYLANDLPYQFVDFVFPFKWSGLFFHPWYLYDENLNDNASFTSRDSVLNSRKCISVAIHDEFVEEKLRKRIKKRVLVFPEKTDSTPPESSYFLVEELKKKALDRTVVSLIGISKRKGFLFLMDLIKSADATKFFFFFSGDTLSHDFNEEEWISVKNLLFTNLPLNCLYYPKSIEEGGKVNALIDASDILFIVYNNFKSSSNFNTKAAVFKKPVISTNRYWIGRVTLKYRMGVAVNEGDTTETLRALELLNEQLKTGSFDTSLYESYLVVHNESNLERGLQCALELLSK